jgi:very-short-patch-repair endonuclease
MNNFTTQQLKTEKKESVNNIVIGQKVTSVKVERAKELRHRMTEEEKVLWQRLRANN